MNETLKKLDFMRDRRSGEKADKRFSLSFAKKIKNNAGQTEGISVAKNFYS